MMMKKHGLWLLLIVNSVFAEWQHPNISQAVFAKSVENRTPIKIITEADNNELNKLYFFTNIRNLTGETITHRWIYQDKVKAQVAFKIKGKRWRVWSSKKFWHSWTGQWRVEVLDTQGNVLLSETFLYKKHNQVKK